VELQPTSGDADLCVYDATGVTQLGCSNAADLAMDVVIGTVPDTSGDNTKSFVVLVYPFVPGGYTLTVRGNT
jgi:hypothetical protein